MSQPELEALQHPINLEIEQNMFARTLESVRGAIENSRRKLAAGVTIGAMALAGANAESSASAADRIPVHAAEASYRSPSTLSPNSALNKVHDVLTPYAGDKLHGRTKPKGRASSYSSGWGITKVYLNPSGGGFNTDCKSATALTYKNYQIGAGSGESSKSCGPLKNSPHSIQEGQFQQPLDRLGDAVRLSVREGSDQQTESITGNRAQVTVNYACPPAETEQSGVRSIVLAKTRYGNSAVVYTC